MSAKTVHVAVRLPESTADEIRSIAKQAGLSPETVIKLLLTLFLRREKRANAWRTQESPNE